MRSRHCPQDVFSAVSWNFQKKVFEEMKMGNSSSPLERNQVASEEMSYEEIIESPGGVGDLIGFTGRFAASAGVTDRAEDRTDSVKSFDRDCSLARHSARIAWRELHGSGRSFPLSPFCNLVAGGSFPYPRSPIHTSSRYVTPVRRKHCGEDPPLVALEGEQFFSGDRVPHPGGLILTAGDDSLAIRGKARRHDKTAVAFQGKQFLAAGCIPHFGRMIVAGGDNPLPIQRVGRP